MNPDHELGTAKQGSELESSNYLAEEDCDDDEDLKLSSATLAALQEFYSEQDIIRKAQSSILEGEKSETNITNMLYDKYNEYIQAFPEDWRLSQFWYDEGTSITLANEVLKLAGTNGRIACISCPSVYRACLGSELVDLYEYDRRFSVFGKNYVYYDYNLPEDVPELFVKTYSVIIVDPPVLALECLQKVTLTLKKLASEDAKIILCTGAVMEKEAYNLLSLVKTSFIPMHKRNLGNEFRCFANYDLHL